VSYSWLRHSMEGNDATLSMIRRAMVQQVDDTGPQQLLNLIGLVGDQPQKVPRVLPHGFASNPPQGAEGILKSLGGRSDRAMFIGGEHPQFRQKNLASGASVLYDQNGNVIFANMKNGIQISTKTGNVAVTAAQGQNIFLGGDGSSGTFAPIMTGSGPALNVMVRTA